MPCKLIHIWHSSSRTTKQLEETMPPSCLGPSKFVLESHLGLHCNKAILSFLSNWFSTPLTAVAVWKLPQVSHTISSFNLHHEDLSLPFTEKVRASSSDLVSPHSYLSTPFPIFLQPISVDAFFIISPHTLFMTATLTYWQYPIFNIPSSVFDTFAEHIPHVWNDFSFHRGWIPLKAQIKITS